MGRLIDSDKLLAELDARSTNPNYRLNMRVIRSIINKQPEVTPTTIHAAWKDGSFLHTKLVDKTGYTKIGECYCSNCRSYLDFSDNYRVPGRYCPWCGAKMEEIE